MTIDGQLAPAVAGVVASIFTVIFARRLRDKARRADLAESELRRQSAAE
jgi:hypothetical protein